MDTKRWEVNDGVSRIHVKKCWSRWTSIRFEETCTYSAAYSCVRAYGSKPGLHRLDHLHCFYRVSDFDIGVESQPVMVPHHHHHELRLILASNG